MSQLEKTFIITESELKSIEELIYPLQRGVHLPYDYDSFDIVKTRECFEKTTEHRTRKIGIILDNVKESPAK